MGMIIINGEEYASSPKDGFPPIIYSDEEREIGVWRDGKPLYQKTISFNISGGTNTTSLGVTNMGICLMICAFKVDGTNSTFIPFIDIEAGSSIDSWSAIVYRANLSSGVITYRAASRFAGHTVYATFQYTKTTDIPGSGKYTTYGGLTHHYSTSEQIVGTWIDGKPIYEKVCEISSGITGGSFTYAHNIDNLKEVVKVDCNYFYSGASCPAYIYPVNNTSSNNSYINGEYTVAYNGCTSTIIALTIGSGIASSLNKISTILCYTKTTD